eukprot:g32565.t1
MKPRIVVPRARTGGRQEAITKFAKSGGIGPLVQAMKDLPCHVLVQRLAMGVLRNFLTGGDMNKTSAARAGAIPTIITAMQRFKNNVSIQEEAIICLTSLCDTLGRASVAARLGLVDLILTAVKSQGYGEMPGRLTERSCMILCMFADDQKLRHDIVKAGALAMAKQVISRAKNLDLVFSEEILSFHVMFLAFVILATAEAEPPWLGRFRKESTLPSAGSLAVPSETGLDLAELVQKESDLWQLPELPEVQKRLDFDGAQLNTCNLEEADAFWETHPFRKTTKTRQQIQAMRAIKEFKRLLPHLPLILVGDSLLGWRRGCFLSPRANRPVEVATFGSWVDDYGLDNLEEALQAEGHQLDQSECLQGPLMAGCRLRAKLKDSSSGATATIRLGMLLKPEVEILDDMPGWHEEAQPETGALKPRRAKRLQARHSRLMAFMRKYHFTDVASPGLTDAYPIHFAASLGDARVLRALMMAGADPEQKTTKGYTPLDYAREAEVDGSHDMVIDLLENKVKIVTMRGFCDMPFLKPMKSAHPVRSAGFSFSKYPTFISSLPQRKELIRLEQAIGRTHAAQVMETYEAERHLWQRFFDTRRR